MTLHCHTRFVPSNLMGSSGLNPWSILRERTHLVFALRRLPDGVEGVYWPRDDRAAILLDDRLSQSQRRAVLLHELIHDERGGGSRAPHTAKDEMQVDREVARRLVPLAELQRLVDRLIDLDEPVSAVDVMEEFDVPVDVANRALWMLSQQ